MAKEVKQAKAILTNLLNEHVFDFSYPNPLVAWKSLKEFARVSFNCSEDSFLFEVGCYSFTGEIQFHMSMVRQFIIDVDGEYDHMEQLHLLFTRDPDQSLEDIEAQVWSYDFDDINSFFSTVENQHIFDLLDKYDDWKFELYHEQV